MHLQNKQYPEQILQYIVLTPCFSFKFWYTLTLKDCEFVMEVKVENTGIIAQ